LKEPEGCRVDAHESINWIVADQYRCYFWCYTILLYNIRFRHFFDVWCLRYEFDVDNNFHVVSHL